MLTIRVFRHQYSKNK